MSEVKFTPGPWNFLFIPSPEEVEVLIVPPNEGNHDGWLSKSICIGSQNNEVLAEVKAYTTSGFLQDFDQWEANAKLIKSAPELLEALLKISKLYHEDRTMSLEAQGFNQQECEEIGTNDYAAQIAIEAIKKATSGK